MSDSRARLTRFFQKYNPANVANIDKVLAAYAGKEDQLWAQLVQKYGPEPPAGDSSSPGASPTQSPRGGGGGGNDTKTRLTRFFQKYNPANVANIDKVLAAYAGKEDQLWAQLIQKYGPEPPADGGVAASPTNNAPSSPNFAAAASSGGGNDTKSRLIRFFEKYNPANVANVDKVLAAYAGKEDQLWAQLTQKYGPEPSSPAGSQPASGQNSPRSVSAAAGGDTKTRLVRFFQKYNPANVANVDKVLAAYAGKEDALWAQLIQKYGPEPPADGGASPVASPAAAPAAAPGGSEAAGAAMDTKSRLTRFFQKYNPANIANIDKVMAAYAGKEGQLWEQLTTKYGPEPPVDGAAASATTATPAAGGGGGDAPVAMDTKSRLTRFFQKYNPSNVANIDKVLAAYSGKEDQLWAQLIQKYGPEPEITPAAGGSRSASVTAPAAAAAAPVAMDTKSRLTRFFQKYNPANVANIDKVMAAYAGKEGQLWAQLIQKYGPEPDATPAASRSGSAAAAPVAMDTKSRLIRFFQKYNPANVANVDKVLAAYAGKEDQLWAQLTQKYGPEPTVVEAAGDAADQQQQQEPMDTKSRLVRFFQKYNPANVANVDKVLAAYAGKEDQLWAQLIQKYGPEPTGVTPAASSAGGSSSATPNNTSRSVSASVATPRDATSNAAAARYFTLSADGTLNPPPQPVQDQLELMDVLDVIAQLPLNILITQLQNQIGPFKKEDDAFWSEYLQAGKSSPQQQQTAAAAASSSTPQQQSRSVSAVSTGGDTKSRLVRFFQKYNPANVANVDKVLAAYAGKEDQLWAQLTQKYGPEPPAAVEAAPTQQQPTSSSGGSDVPMDTKSRLIRFFQKYNPANVANVDKVLAAYAGKEDALWAQLTQKYGPEPPAATPDASRSGSAAAGAAPVAMDTKSRLTRFFQKYNPANVANIDKVMAAYAGKEDQLWAQLIQKYGPEPAVEAPVPAAAGGNNDQRSAAAPVAMDTKSRLIRFFQKYNPANVANVDKVLAAYAGKEDQLWAQLTQKYGPEPPAAAAETPDSSRSASAATGTTATTASSANVPMDTKSRLTRYFQKYNPANVANIDKVMAAYAGKEDQLWAQLIQKYGPEPEVTPDASRSVSAASSAVPMDTKSRLTRFFQKYNPANVANIDKVMAAYAGKEDALWAQLIQKYGPEPAVTPAATPDVSRSGSAAAAAPVAMDTKSRLTRFFQKYNPANVANIDKVMAAYAGKEDQLWAQLIQKYGPEPVVDQQQGGSRSVSMDQQQQQPASPVVQQQAQMNQQQARPAMKPLDVIKLKGHIAKHFASADQKVPLSQFLINTLGSEQATSNFINSVYQADESIEGQVQRIISKHAPEKLLAKDVIETCVYAVKKADGDTRILVEVYGSAPLVKALKPVQSVPISTIQKVDDIDSLMFAPGAPLEASLRRQRKAPAASPPFLRHRSFPFKFAEDEVAEGADRQVVDVAEELAEGIRISEDAKETEAGDVNNEDAKTYPEEDEFWVRLSFKDGGVGVKNGSFAGPPGQGRSRAFTEFQGGSASAAGGEGGNSSAASGGPPTSPKSGPATPRPNQKLVAAEFADSANESLTNDRTLCPNCSTGVQRAFRSLWTAVGQRHRQLLLTAQMKAGFMEKLASGRFRSTFQKRFFKVNDKGLHYFMEDNPLEKAKGHKHFTEQSTVITNPDPTRFPQVADDGYYYFALTVNLNNENFLLRVPTKQEKDEWISFIKEAIERLKLTTMVGQDANPGRWRGRYAGLRELQATETAKTGAIVEKCDLAAAERDRLKLELAELQNEVSAEEQQVEDLKEQAKILRSRIDTANNEHQKKLVSLERAKVEAEQEKQRMDHRTIELLEEQKASSATTEAIRSELIRIRLEIAEEEDKQQNLLTRLKKLEAKRRQAEERRPTTMVSRALGNTGLAYRPPGAAPLHSSHLSAMELQRTKEAREKIVDKLVAEAREKKERARIRMENAEKLHAPPTKTPPPEQAAAATDEKEKKEEATKPSADADQAEKKEE